MRQAKVSPRVLIISNKHDFASDYVVFHLENSGIAYLRLNRDQFSEFNLALSCHPPVLYGRLADFDFEVTASRLRSVYFRAPVYLRDIYQSHASSDQQLERTQWAAFIRALTVFDKAFWINHPRATYQAEIKPYQLSLAHEIGFDVPQTLITNTGTYGASLSRDCEDLIIKSLDTAILRTGQSQAFIYTNRITADELTTSWLSNAPAIIQQAVIPKIDIRVTVIRDVVFAVTITINGAGIDGDWRTQKETVAYDPFDLPPSVETKCRTLTKRLGLQFAAIDLALSFDKYYFLEVNPTGEWAWLVDECGLKIDHEIATALIEGQETPL